MMALAVKRFSATMRASNFCASAKSFFASTPTTTSSRICGKRPWSSQALKKGDRDSYLNQEKAIRENVGLPPYGRLAAIILSGNDAAETERFARSLSLIAPLADGITLLGPAVAPIAMVRGRHRWRFLVKAGRDVNLQAFLRLWLKDVKPKGSLALQMDVDPYNFL